MMDAEPLHPPATSPASADRQGATVSPAEIRDWIVERVAYHAGLSPSGIRTDESVLAYGIDSMRFVVMVGELEEWLGCRFQSNPIAVYPSIDELSGWLAAELAAGRTDLDPEADEQPQRRPQESP